MICNRCEYAKIEIEEPFKNRGLHFKWVAICGKTGVCIKEFIIDSRLHMTDSENPYTAPSINLPLWCPMYEEW